jgi:hypothetical protein
LIHARPFAKRAGLYSSIRGGSAQVARLICLDLIGDKKQKVAFMSQTALHTNGANRHARLQELAGKVSTASGRESILRTLAYFDIFHYPLTKDEIHQFLECDTEPTELGEWLQSLIAEKIIFNHNDLYSIQNNPLLAHRRREGNLRAEKLLEKAHRIGRFLYKFPYVKAIGVSGSLSKNFADERSDIDFFIITSANRLWIARTLMHLFKKLTFLTGRQHLYCMNYYVDEQALALEDKNIFTAIELKTLLPISGEHNMIQFFAANPWAMQWLPACPYRNQQHPDAGTPGLKRITEWLLNNKVGNSLDNYLYRLTSRRWKQKETKGKRNDKGQVMTLITGKHFSRTNPGAFQEKVLALYERKLEMLGVVSRGEKPITSFVK